MAQLAKGNGIHSKECSVRLPYVKHALDVRYIT